MYLYMVHTRNFRFNPIIPLRPKKRSGIIFLKRLDWPTSTIPKPYGTGGSIMLYQVNSDGTVRILNRCTEQTQLACKRAKIPVDKRPISKDKAKRIIQEWVSAHT